MSSSLEEVLLALAPWTSKHRRMAWRPVISDLPSQGSARSQFGGLPLLPRDEPWPRCPNCGDPLTLFLQLDLASLPPQSIVAPGRGLLQMFYCTNAERECDVQLEGWEPFSKCHVLRIVEGTTTPTSARHVRVFPQRSISDWSGFDDLPHPEDHKQLGLVYEYDFPKKQVHVLCAEIGVSIRNLGIDDGVAEAIGPCASGDKLGGWPAWVQGAEYPTCPECGALMALVFQVDSEDHVPFMFGDVGCGHITQCPRHPHVLAFGWACG
jgi:hypothetical protein